MTPEALTEAHRFFSADCFNKCWSFIDKKDRTPEEVETMLALAHGSLLHWKSRPDCQPMNLSTALWQISRVHALAGQPDAARWYGDRCLAVSQEKKLAPFYVGYAYEAISRAELLRQRMDEARKSLDLAAAEMAKVSDPEEKQLLADDLEGLTRAVPAR